MSDHHFFFSYSRIDTGPYLDKFFEDLRLEVHHKVGRKEISIRNIAFRDQSNIEIGVPWSTELTAALAESRMLVCIYTPAYFRSEFCGKEVQVIKSRIDLLGSVDIPFIIPVLWENPSIIQVPKGMDKYQYSTIEDTGELYSEKGLNYLIKINKYKDDYMMVLDHLATKIAKVAETKSLPKYVDAIDIEKTPNYFSVSNKTENAAKISNLGPRLAQFIFIAGKKQELFSLKQHVENYDVNGWSWKPFDEENEVGIIAQNVATSKRMHFSSIEFGPDLINKIKEAELNNSLVIIIVDPWTVKISSYKEFLSNYDNTNYINSGLLVPWNFSDDETTQEKNQLQENLHQALSHCIAGNRSQVRDEILSLEELAGCISSAIDEAHLRIMKFAQVFRKLEGDKEPPLPFIAGPGGAQ